MRLVAPADWSGAFYDHRDTKYVVDDAGQIDVPESMVRELLAEGFQRAPAPPPEIELIPGPRGKDGVDGIGVPGPTGPTGKQGPIGPMPRHEWDGTELRFQLEPDQWGAWVDLQGPPGKDGKGGGVAPSGIFGGGPIDLSGIVTTTIGNSYFPAGW